MTRHRREGQADLISWAPGDAPDWDTPDSFHGDHRYCGNCGLDAPGCGCPRGVLEDALREAGGTGRSRVLRLLATWVAELQAKPLIQMTVPDVITPGFAKMREQFQAELESLGLRGFRVLPTGDGSQHIPAANKEPGDGSTQSSPGDQAG